MVIDKLGITITPRCMLLVVLGIVLIAAGCSTNKPWRVPPDVDAERYLTCAPNGQEKGPLIEKVEERERTWLTFIEFTERGNLFNRGCLKKVYQLVEREILESRGRGGLALVVYIHGWKHNASPNDKNVQDFRRMLAGFPQTGQRALSDDVQRALPYQYRLDGGKTEARTVVGIYIGWRGAVLGDWMPHFLENLSYWDRKSTAEEIGKGGVTEVLLSLGRLARCGHSELATRCSSEEQENIFLTIGHSFGAAIVVAAMNEVIMQRLIEERLHDDNPETGCIRTRPLSDGMILLNPAIEANQLLQIKELIADHCFSKHQDILMHVLSSRGDIATHQAFPIGQTLDTLLTNQQSLVRSDPARRPLRKLHERDLDVTTVGNFPQFWTGILRRTNNTWNYRALTRTAKPEDMNGNPIPNHVWAPVNSPVQMIYTDKNFIEDHNGIFNHRVVAYASAVVAESLALVRDQPVPNRCAPSGSLSFDFGSCFDFYLELLAPAQAIQ